MRQALLKSASTPEQAEALERQFARLVGSPADGVEDGLGHSYKAMAIVGAGASPPVGFEDASQPDRPHINAI